MKTYYLFIACWLPFSCFAQANQDCDWLTQAASEKTLVAWNSRAPVLTRRGAEAPWQIKFGQLRVIATIEDGQIREPRNAVLEKGTALWNVLDVDQELVLTDIYPVHYQLRPGVYWCLFSAGIDQSRFEEDALFTNDREFQLRLPTANEQAVFDSNMHPDSYCANRAGLFLRDSEDIPPCEAPELIGLTDVNGNQKLEFWATEVLRYSTGIAVWEHRGARYEKIYSACPLCSD